MNIQEAQCLKCPARKACKEPQKMPNGELRMQTCPPQTRAITIYVGTNPDNPTMSGGEATSEFSKLTKEVRVIYHCPLSERGNLVDLLKIRVHPNRNEHFNTGITSSTQHPAIQGYLGNRFKSSPHQD